MKKTVTYQLLQPVVCARDVQQEGRTCEVVVTVGVGLSLRCTCTLILGCLLHGASVKRLHAR